MAKKTYKKKNYVKSLPRVGSTVAIAVAMTAALNVQANASEVDESVFLPADTPVAEEAVVETPSVEAPGDVDVVVEPAAENEAVEAANTETVAENTGIVETNEQIQQSNDATAELNEEITGGAVVDPGLELPEAPETPATENLGTEDYNEVVDDYNETVDNYNQGVDDYNQGVDDYNAAADQYDQDQQASYEEDLKQYEENKAAHDTAVQEHTDQQAAWDEYDQKVEEHKDKVEDLTEQYNKDKELYDQQYQEELGIYNEEEFTHQEQEEAWTDYDQKVEEHKDKVKDLTEQYNKDMEAYDKAYGALEDQYEEDLAEYEHKEEQKEIYDDVVDYNENTVKPGNEKIEEDNAALEEAADAATVDSLEEAAESNAEVDEKLKETDAGQEMLNILGGYQDLLDTQAGLEAEAKALDEEAAKNHPLGSDAYTAYLARVKAFNDAVAAHNEKVAAYNEAVGKYNTAVGEYNETLEPETEVSSEGDYEQGTADWGNIDIDGHTPRHLDVKYSAAISANAVEQPDGTVKYEETATKYTVDGVYTDSEHTDEYALNYLNKNSGTYRTQDLNKNNVEKEFRIEGNTNGISISPVTGKVSFYMTVTDEDGNTTGLNVNLDASSTYADGTYYKPAAYSEVLQYYRDSNGNALPTKTINGETYYDISGQSVFVISSLACNGARARETGYGQNKKVVVSPDGLDLVLNMQTLIKLHQEDSAQKITYMSYLLGKTATATDPGDPPTPPTYDPPKLDLPDAPPPPEFDRPGDWDKTPPKYDPPTLNLPDAPPPPEFDRPGDGPGDWDEEKPEEPISISRLEYVQHLEGLEKKQVLDVEIPEPGEGDEPIWFNLDMDDEIVTIPDEEVPLAKAPKTGDLSGLWAAISALSIGGIGLLNRKRREEENA